MRPTLTRKKNRSARELSIQRVEAPRTFGWLSSHVCKRFCHVHKVSRHHDIYERNWTSFGNQSELFLKVSTLARTYHTSIYITAGRTQQHSLCYETSLRACFMCMALLRNTRVGPHKDRDDFKADWVAMCCFGEFEGSALCLPDLRLEGIDGSGRAKLDYKPGDVMFLRASVLEHFVAPFLGNRSVFVFSTKKDC